MGEESEDASFRIHLSSDSSKTFFTSNTKTSFGVHLESSIKLVNGQWEVGITQVLTSPTDKATDSPLFIYCSITEKIHVSDKRARCLRILPPLSEKTNNSFDFATPYYELVTGSEFQDITFWLRDSKGVAYNLSNTGPSTLLTLHFRRRSS